MFLNLISEPEKKAFLNLAYLIAKHNGKIDKEERMLLDTYEREMGVSQTVKGQNEISLEKIIPVFDTETSKRIVFLEAVALAFADGICNEEKIINQLRMVFGFSTEYYEEVRTWLKEFNTLYSKGLELISG